MTNPVIVCAFYAAVSAATFLLYAKDKSAARDGRRRTPERTLHLFALMGGWPGALLAQRLLHHKSGKLSFQVIFWITVAANCGIVSWLLTLRLTWLIL